MKTLLQNRLARQAAALAVLLGWLVPCSGQGVAPEPVTSVEALIQAADAEVPRVVSLDLEGTVWWSNAARGRLVLSDDSAAAQLELDLQCAMPGLADRFLLQGRCTVRKARDVIKLSPVPLVESDGLHARIEESGSRFLQAGYYPLRVAWLNRTGLFGLDVECEGPDLPRQPIPDSMLFREVIDPLTGQSSFVNGLDYGYYEGQWWRMLPNFDHLTAVRSGTVERFDLGVRERDSHIGIRFDGFLRVPREGEYTFYLSSDDGSRLFLGPSSLSVQTVGRAPLPTPALLPIQPEAPVTGQEFRWTEMEGLVTSLHRPDHTLEFEMKTDAGFVRVKVAEDDPASFTLRPQNRIRAVGVSRTIRSVYGDWVPGEFFVQRWEDITQRHVTPAIWAEYPLVLIKDLLEQDSLMERGIVHLKGRVRLNDSGTAALLDDGTGRVELDVHDPESQSGHYLEVLGCLARKDGLPVIENPFYREAGGTGPESGTLPLLTTVEQIYQLSPEEAGKNYPLRVRGVITSPMESDGAVFQDATRGIYVDLGGPVNLQVGDYCEIEGFSGPYQFSQFIQASRVTLLGAGNLPEPIRPTWDQLINGSMHCNYVELEGVVTSDRDNGVTLLTRGGRINVRLNPAGPEIPQGSLGATLRLRGCLLADWDAVSHRVMVGSIYLDQHWITIVHPAPADPFDMPAKRIGDLLQFDPNAGALQRVKVAGQLVYKGPDVCCLMEDGNGLRFMPVHYPDAEIGDRLDVVGFLELGGSASILREALVRRTGHDPLPPPRRLNADDLIRNEYDATLVQVEGTLLEITEKADRVVLEMQNGLRRFVAEVDDKSFLDEDLPPGSELALRGIYLGQGGNRVLGQSISTFVLLLHSGDDIRILSRPSWWTLGRMLSVVGVLVTVLLAALIWISQLHRKVEERTLQLGDQIRRRQRAERQRELEHERARLAHDLHDDLGAGLTEVNMLTSLISSPATLPEEKAKYVEDLSNIALRMVTSLDEIVWAVNPRNDTVASLAGYFGAYARRLLELASVGCGLDIDEDLPDCPLDPRFRQECFLAFKEALTNVVQHAGATKVWLRIRVEQQYLIVMVSDDGTGVLPDEAARAAGADGLLNMKARMQTLGGECVIDSRAGEGTSVCLKAPLEEETK